MAELEASYFDGRTAARRKVTLRLETEGVRIAGVEPEAFWRYQDIRHATPAADTLPVTFRSAAAAPSGARLVVDDRATADALSARCSDLDGRAGQARRQLRGTALAAVGVVSVALLAVGAIHYLPRVVAPLIPVAWEKALGDRVVEDIAALFGQFEKGAGGRCTEAPGRAALDRLVARLTAGARLPYPVTVQVIDVGIVNALATPGGNIVVFREMLTEAESPEEAAGVIAHEMGHVIARHPAQAVARELGVSLIFDMLLGGFGGGAAGGLGQAMLSSAYSRDAEREADAIGTALLRDAGISTAGFVAFFDRLAKEAGSVEQAMSFISSHPPSAERADAARNAGPAGATPAMTAGEWQALRAICGERKEMQE